MDQILNTILNNTYTLPELKHRINILRTYLAKKFFGAYEDQPLSPEDQNWINNLPTELLESFNKTNLYEILKTVEEKAFDTQVLTLYLPFEATGQTVKLIADKTRGILHRPVLLEIRYDSVLIAGLALSLNGIYKDYSLRAKIEERKAEILGSFKKFLR